MKKLIRLVRAGLTQDMHLFKLNYKKAKWTKPMVSFFLCFSLMAIFAVLTYLEIEVLKGTVYNYASLFLGLLSAQAVTFVEGVQKSQSVLIDCKDNDLLISMPVDSSKIMLSRVIKYIIFQSEFHFLCYAPTVLCYGVIHNSEPVYWIMASVSVIFLPVLPSLIGAVCGFIIRQLTEQFANRKVAENVLSFICCALIGYVYLRLMISVEKLAMRNVVDIEKMMLVYYPAGQFVELVQDFDGLKFGLYLVVHLLSIAAFCLLMSHSFDKAIRHPLSNKRKKHRGQFNIRVHSIQWALVIKEIRTLLDSTIYTLNTLLIPLLIVVIVIGIAFYYSALMRKFFGANLIVFEMVKPYLFFAYFLIVLYTCAACQIASSSVSMEKKTINLSKTLPISPMKALRAKIYCSLLMLGSPLLLCTVIFLIRFQPSIEYAIPILVITLTAPLLNSLFGLIVNILLPKMHATNDAEIIKQSASTAICLFSSLFFSSAPLLIAYIFEIEFELIMIGICVLTVLMILILVLVLKKWGCNQYRKIMV